MWQILGTNVILIAVCLFYLQQGVQFVSKLPLSATRLLFWRVCVPFLPKNFWFFGWWRVLLGRSCGRLCCSSDRNLSKAVQ